MSSINKTALALNTLFESMAPPSHSKSSPTQPTSAPNRLKIFRTCHEQHGVVELFVPEGRAGDNSSWEESRFYFQTGMSTFPDDPEGTLIRLEPRDGEEQTFSSVVVVDENHPLAKTLLRNPHVYFSSIEDVCSCKLEMLYHASVLREHMPFVDTLGIATMTRMFFGKDFDRAFTSYSAFLDTLERTNFRSAFYGHNATKFSMDPQLIHQHGEALIRQNLNSPSSGLNIYVCAMNPSTIQRRAIPIDGGSVSAAADQVFDLMTEETSVNSHVPLAMVVFPFDLDSIFLFSNGGFLRIGVDTFDDLSLTAPLCWSWTRD